MVSSITLIGFVQIQTIKIERTHEISIQVNMAMMTTTNSI